MNEIEEHDACESTPAIEENVRLLRSRQRFYEQGDYVEAVAERSVVLTCEHMGRLAAAKRIQHTVTSGPSRLGGRYRRHHRIIPKPD